MVTVIIPNYNHARYLPRRIESVLQQSYSDLEIILLDDCSTDNSLDIIKYYSAKDSRIQVVLNEKNSGSTFKQWNKGIRLAKGEYIWIAESDDYADEKLVENLVDKLTADNNINLAYCGSWYVDEQNNKIDNDELFYKELDSAQWTQDFVESGKVLVSKYMSYRNIIPNASAVIFRKSIIEKVGLANETFRLNGDWLFWAKILNISKVAFIAERLNYFRQHTNNVRSTTTSDGTSLLELTRLVRELNKSVIFEPLFLDKILIHLSRTWINSFILYKIPFSKHRKIYLNLKEIDVNINQRLYLESKYIFPNKSNAIKQIIGDGLIYKFILNKKK